MALMLLTGKFLSGRRRGELSPEEQQVLEAAVARVVEFAPGETIVGAGQPLAQSNLLLQGFVSRSTHSEQGARQILGMHVVGDFLDLHGFPLGTLDHDVVAISAVEIACVPHDALTRITITQPHLTKMLWFSTLIDAAIHREWVFRNSRLAAVNRVAHFVCEMNARLENVGFSDGLSFMLPLTQIDLGDACGLTSVHVNRVLRELRERELVIFRNGKVEIINRAALERFAEFDRSYLYGDGTNPSQAG